MGAGRHGRPRAFALRSGSLEPGIWSDDPVATAEFYHHVLGLEELWVSRHASDHREQALRVPTGTPLQLELFDVEAPFAASASSYVALWLADPRVDAPRVLRDPHGLVVHHVPVGHRGVRTVGVTCRVDDPARQLRFYVDGFGAVPTRAGVFLGDTQIFIEARADGERVSGTPPRSNGLVDITVVVDDLVAAVDHLTCHGAAVTLRQDDRMMVCWLVDPHDNHVELVEHGPPTPSWRRSAPVRDAAGEIREWQRSVP